MIFYRFLIRLGLLLAPFLAPKLGQNRLKIAPRRFLRPFFFKNGDFHADLCFPRFFHQNRPQDEAKIGLRSPQDGPKTVLKSFFFDVEICLRFGFVWDAALVPFWGGFGGAKSVIFGIDFRVRFQECVCMCALGVRGRVDASWERLRAAQERPRAAQERPRAAQERSWVAPGAVLAAVGSFFWRFWLLWGRSWAALRCINVARFPFLLGKVFLKALFRFFFAVKN